MLESVLLQVMIVRSTDVCIQTAAVAAVTFASSETFAGRPITSHNGSRKPTVERTIRIGGRGKHRGLDGVARTHQTNRLPADLPIDFDISYAVVDLESEWPSFVPARLSAG